jgi:hypothetical protein
MRGPMILGAMLLGWSCAAAADEQPICADRPSKSTPTCTVPAGHFQVETGLADWSVQKSKGERDTSITVAETTVIYGISGSADIELDVTPWQRQISGGSGFHDSSSGFGDVIALYKQRLTPSEGAFQLAVVPFVKFPTAKRSLGNGKVEGGVLVPIDYSIGKSPLSINLTPELDWAADSDGTGHHAAMTQVASLGIQATEKLSLSAELWGMWDWDPAGTGKQASADVSAAYLVRKDVQLDAGANFGLNRQTPDLELYTGVSVRF